MTAAILDGKHLAQVIQAEIAAGVANLLRERGVRPGLATVLVGTNEASKLYVRTPRSRSKSATPAAILAWMT